MMPGTLNVQICHSLELITDACDRDKPRGLGDVFGTDENSAKQ